MEVKREKLGNLEIVIGSEESLKKFREWVIKEENDDKVTNTVSDEVTNTVSNIPYNWERLSYL